MLDGRPLDCGKAQMCGALPLPICSCNSSGCAAGGYVGGPDFDLRFNGDTAEGSDTLHSNSRVYFTRVH
jgi:hypothetical protein